MTREITFYENYFIQFYLSLDANAQEKIEYVFKIIRTVDRIPGKFFKHIEGTAGLVEIRIISERNIYRVFCCFETGKIVILLNGFHKKSRKTPKKEIQKALRLKKEYFEKNKGV